MFPSLENDLSAYLSLDGDWRFRFGDAPEQTIPVPSAWEAHTRDKLTDGPAFYRRAFTLPDDWLGKQMVLDARAISFDATVRANGQVAGHHRGLWSPFQVDLTRFLDAGENEIEIEVWKPGVRFPMRESLAGFLPDVCTTFGGIWQGIGLRAFERAALSDLKVFTGGSGWVEVRGRIEDLALQPPSPASGEAPRSGASTTFSVTLDVLDAHQHLLASSCSQLDGVLAFHLECHVPDFQTWQPASPYLYGLRVSAWDGDELIARATRSAGFRDVAIRDGKTWLNAHPLHLRGVLDWGWNPEGICPSSSGAEEQFRKAQALGFNLVKLCLFVPDERFFNLADEHGMLLWLEMPMWLPRVTPDFKALALREYREVFARLHHHPSIAVVSLGCELNADADADFLRALNALAREWFPNALVCDNSGSAEAYGGVLTALGDFYDYHFYTDLHFFPALVDHFDRAYQPRKPWLYGEFCDADTLRDFSLLQPEPWWLTDPVPLERDDFLHMRDYRSRLDEAGVTDGGAALTHIARQQATAIRKFIFEHVRARSATGGYVITGWMDTPIATSGVVDDFGQLKFPPEEWQRFNAAVALTIDRERRRRWVGGDRPAHRDPFTWWQGERAEVHAILSNGGPALGRARLEWELADTRGVRIASGAKDVSSVGAGEVSEVAVLSFQMPQPPDGKPVELLLTAKLGSAHNSWRLWAVPRPVAGTLAHDHDFARLDREEKGVKAEALITSELTAEMLDWVRAGGSALLWLRQPDARYTRPMPFWREAIHVFMPHKLWERVPHPGYADLRFFGVATDFAIDRLALQTLLGLEARSIPVWRRFDARAMTWADYLIEVQYGAGHMFASTLRFEGGLGYQPDTFDTNPWGAWLLASLLAGRRS
ncbi:MAG: glycoside hydrolase family 2 protein [Anaerolineales bacterium]